MSDALTLILMEVDWVLESQRRMPPPHLYVLLSTHDQIPQFTQMLEYRCVSALRPSALQERGPMYVSSWLALAVLASRVLDFVVLN